MESAFLLLYIIVQRAEPHPKRQCQNSFDLGAEGSLLEPELSLIVLSVGVRAAELQSRLLGEAVEPPSVRRLKT